MFESAEAGAVETQPWVDPSHASNLVANFARVHILVSLFDGDPDKWIKFILRSGTIVERQSDLPFVQALKSRIRGEPLLMDDLRRIVRELSTIVDI
jgi:hypothetical protein